MSWMGAQDGHLKENSVAVRYFVSHILLKLGSGGWLEKFTTIEAIRHNS